MEKTQADFVKFAGGPFLKPSEIRDLLRSDATARSLALSNLVIVALALIENWPLKTLLFIYCGQNVIIGVFNVLRILKMRKIVLPRSSSSAQPAEVPSAARYFLAGFFALHYGMFQFGYFQFIGRPDPKEFDWIALSLAVFFAHHLFSFRTHAAAESDGRDFAKAMFFPYLRIIPMHLTIIFGGFFTLLLHNALADKIVLVFFMLLKTSADLKMHQVEHAGEPQARPRDPLPEI